MDISTKILGIRRTLWKQDSIRIIKDVKGNCFYPREIFLFVDFDCKYRYYTLDELFAKGKLFPLKVFKVFIVLLLIFKEIVRPIESVLFD